MKLCLVLADNQGAELEQSRELQNLYRFIAEIAPLGVETILLREIIDEEAEENTIQIEAIQGGLQWNFKRGPRPDQHLFWDPYFESVLHRIVWEYGIEIVQLLVSEQRAPTSLAPLCSILGTKLIVSCLDATIACPKGTLLDQDEVECAGPTNSDTCGSCIAAGKFSTFHASKHRAIIWERHLQRVFSHADTVTYTSDNTLSFWDPLKVVPNLSLAIVASPLTALHSDDMVRYVDLYRATKPEPILAYIPQPVTLLIAAFEGWRNAEALTAPETSVDRCLESIAEQAVAIRAQVVVCLDQKRADVRHFLEQKYQALKIQFVAYEVTPSLGEWLTRAAPNITGRRTFLLSCDRSYTRYYFAAHQSVAQHHGDGAVLGLTTWPHGKGLESLEEFALTRSNLFRIAAPSTTLTPETPWQGISLPTPALARVFSNAQTLSDALALPSPLSVTVSPRALAALHESIGLNAWLSAVTTRQKSLGRTASTSIISLDTSELKQLSETAHGNLGAHRTLGFAGSDRIVGYDELFWHLLHKATPEVWLTKSFRTASGG